MRPLLIPLREAARFRKVPSFRGQGPRPLGSVSLSSSAAAPTPGAGGGRESVRRPPTGAMELRRAAEVQKCADKGWNSALICLGNMRKGGVAPGTAAYNVALRACAGAGEWDRAAALLQDMEGSGAAPDATVESEIKAAMQGRGPRRLHAEGAPGLDDDDLSCPSSSATVNATAATITAGKRSFTSGSGGGLSGGGGGGGGGGRAPFAGMHTMTAVGAGGDWSGGRPAHDYWCGGSGSEDLSSRSSSSSGGGSGSGGGGGLWFDSFSSNPESAGGSVVGMGSAGDGSVVATLLKMMTGGADGGWPSHRPAHDYWCNNSTTTTTTTTTTSTTPADYDDTFWGPPMPSDTTSGRGAGNASITAGMHTMAAVGADGDWPSRRPTTAPSDSAGGGRQEHESRSLLSAVWGGKGRRWHGGRHQEIDPADCSSGKGSGSGTTAAAAKGKWGGEGAWPASAKAAAAAPGPFAGGCNWGDD